MILASFELLADTLNEPRREDLLPRHNRIPCVPHRIYPYPPQNTIECDLHRVILMSRKDIPVMVPDPVDDPQTNHSFPADVP